MAIPLNVFKTFTAELTTTEDTVYTAPSGVTAIVLMAQVANVSGAASKVTALHVDGAVETELVKDFAIGPDDSTSVTTGKLILQAGQSIKASAQGNEQLKIVLSVLETLDA